MEDTAPVVPQPEGWGLLRRATSFAYDGAKMGKEILFNSAPAPVKAGLEKLESNLWELDGKYPQVRDYLTKNGDSIMTIVDTTIDAKLVGPAEKVISTFDGAVIRPSAHLLEEAKRVVDTTVVQPALLRKKRADELVQEGLHLGKRVIQDIGIAENGQFELSTVLHAGSEKLKAAVSHPVETTIAVGQKTVDIVRPQVERLASEYVRPQVGRFKAPVEEFLGHCLDRADGVVEAYLPSSNDQERFEDANGTLSVHRLMDTSSKVVRRTTRRIKEIADSTLADAKEAVPTATAAAKEAMPRVVAAASVATTQTAPIIEDLTKTAANLANVAVNITKGAVSVTLLTWLAAVTVVFDRTTEAARTVKDTITSVPVTTLPVAPLAWFNSTWKLMSNAVVGAQQSAAIAALTARDTAMLQFQGLASTETAGTGVSTLSSLLLLPSLALDRSRSLYNAIAPTRWRMP